MADTSTGNTIASTPRTKEQQKWKSQDVKAKALLASHMQSHFRWKYLNVDRSEKMWTVLRHEQKDSGAPHFHSVNDDIRSLKFADFPTCIPFNNKFKSLMCDLGLCDSERRGISDMEATYIILGVLFQDNEVWRTFRHIHSNASRPQQLLDEMAKHNSRCNSERENGGGLS